MPEFVEIRSPIDLKRLEAFLLNPHDAITSAPLPKLQKPLQVKQFVFGQSNPTYLVTDATQQTCVVRRKPMQNAKLVSKLAHAIEREFFMLHGIRKCNEHVAAAKQVPVPKVYCLCEDEAVLDYVFYVMEYVPGRLIKRPDMPKIALGERAKYWDAIMATLGAIHSVDCERLVTFLPARHFPQFQPEKLAQLRASGPSYFQRQLKTLAAVEERQSRAVDPIPGFARLAEWILAHAPHDPLQVTLVHGDFKIDNVLFHESEPRIVAVLDWELCTFGHPMFDVANLLQPYVFPQALNQLVFRDLSIGADDPASRGLVQRVLRLYEARLGHAWRAGDAKNNPVDLWKLGSVFGLLRICVISQGIAMRVKSGTASSASAEMVAGLYPDLAELALEIVEDKTKM